MSLELLLRAKEVIADACTRAGYEVILHLNVAQVNVDVFAYTPYRQIAFVTCTTATISDVLRQRARLRRQQVRSGWFLEALPYPSRCWARHAVFPLMSDLQGQPFAASESKIRFDPLTLHKFVTAFLIHRAYPA